MSEIIVCPHCNQRVLPTGTGECPSCRNHPDRPAEVKQDAQASPKVSESPPEQAWENFQQSMNPDAHPEQLRTLIQAEQEFSDCREQTSQDYSLNIDAAERIERDLLPMFDSLIEESSDDQEAPSTGTDSPPDWEEYLRLRAQSWRLLVRALREHDPDALKRHVELWSQTGMIWVQLTGESHSFQKPNPLRRVKEFQQALVSFTPKLLVLPTLILVNALIYLMMFVKTGNLTPTVESVLEWGANYGPRTMNGEWWRLVSNLFLHFGVLHLSFNMLILWDVGRYVERIVGNVGFVLLYFLSGIAGSLASLAWNPVVVSAGASGAVFGVVGTLLGLLAFRRDSIPAEVLKHLRTGMTVFVVFNIFYGLTHTGIDSAAHVGGFVAGFLFGLILSQPLSKEMLPKRRFRNTLVTVIGTLGVLIGVDALPDPPADILYELQLFAASEERIMQTWNDLVIEGQKGTVDDARLIAVLETSILPGWSRIRGQLESLIDEPHAEQFNLSLLLKYVRAREKSWSLRLEGAKRQDLETIEAANDAWTESEQLLKQLLDQVDTQ